MSKKNRKKSEGTHKVNHQNDPMSPVWVDVAPETVTSPSDLIRVASTLFNEDDRLEEPHNPDATTLHSHLTNSYTVLWENEDGGTLTPSEALSFIQGEEFKDVRKALGLALKAGLFSPEVTVWYRRYTDSGNVARQRNEAHALAFMDFWFEELFGYPLDDENVSHTYKVMDDRGNFEEAF